MRKVSHVALIIVLPLLASACDRSDPAPAALPASTPPTPTTVSRPVPEDERARQFPEDLTIDPERDPRVRERAKQLNALPVTAMKGLKPGDEVLILVRADKGGGTIYGSGPYTIDSALRKAVLHAGALKDRELGIVRVKVLKPDGDHPSVPANGITPTAYGKYHTSYTLERVEE